MRLYVNQNRTQWAGTQADAKKDLGQFDMWEVPTDKPGLLAFLNKEAGFNIEPAITQAKPESVEDAIIRVRADKFDRENTPTFSKGIHHKKVICYLEYNPSNDEVTNVRMVSSEQLATDNFPAWDRLDRDLTRENSGEETL
jgi:hypothetical protein